MKAYKPYSVVWDANRNQWRVRHGYPTNPGTTGWYDDREEAKQVAKKMNDSYIPPDYLRHAESP